jgi:hypothetical protein
VQFKKKGLARREDFKGGAAARLLLFWKTIILLPFLLPCLGGITSFPPRGSGTAAKTLCLTLLLYSPKYQSDHVPAYTRACVFQLSHREPSRKCVDGCLDHFGLSSARTFYLAEAFLEFFICRLDYEKDIVDIRPGIMRALVPMSGTELERLVITLLVLLDQALKAYIAADFISKLIALEEKQQARHPAVAVTERMDAQEIKVEGSHGN